MILELVKKIKISTETAKGLEEKFSGFLVQADEMSKQVMGIEITDISQTKEMKEAGALRKALKKVRVEAGKVKKELKEDTIAYNKAVDKINNTIVEKIKPLEDHLEKQEKFAQNKIKEALEKLEAERIESLKPYEEFVPVGIKVGELKTEEFEKLLNGCKIQAKSKIEEEKRLERERLEHERIEKRYNSRLSLISTLGAFFNQSLDVKNLSEEDFMIALKTATEEKKKYDEEQDRIRLENELLKKEKEEADRIAREAQEKKDKEIADLKAKEEARIKKEQEKVAKEAEEKRLAEEAEKAKLLAPDKEKLISFGENLLALDYPELKNKEAESLMDEIKESIIKMVGYLNKKASEL